MHPILYYNALNINKITFGWNGWNSISCKTIWICSSTHPHLLSFFTKTPLLHCKKAILATQNHLFCKPRKILLQVMIKQRISTTTDDGLMRTLERATLRACGMTGARPAQGAATTTDDGLMRTHERTSLQVELIRLKPGI